MTEQGESLLSFPCSFPIKAMGKAEHDIEAIFLEILQRHAPGQPDYSVKIQTSSKGGFVSVTMTIEASSREQLDAIYQDLTDHTSILMSL
ncbi:MAG TPA: DUF493 domain-containing protein [Gammaproteobacteria bacterium]|nr:DUF493 domain-containing protein [Gammaproteobacteria bacterium]